MPSLNSLEPISQTQWPVPRKYALRPVDVLPVRACWCMMAHVLVALDDIFCVLMQHFVLMDPDFNPDYPILKGEWAN